MRHKAACAIADEVLAKCAASEESALSRFPGTMVNAGLGVGGFAGVMGAGFSPQAAKYIPNDRLRALVGLLGGAAIGGGSGALGHELAAALLRREQQRQRL
jgi:hypothetical protein